MSYQNIFKRYEVKYLITKEEKKALIKIMDEYMMSDEYGESCISNIYFDTPDKLLIRRSLEKPCYKEKLRMRSYGIVNSNEKVFIEIKKKYKDIVYKRRMGLEEKTAMKYMIDHIPLLNQTQISKEIDYLMYAYRNMEPSVFIAYNRQAFFSKSDKNFRMTFDENIFIRDYDLALNLGIYGERILHEDRVILEVKTVLGLPKWLLDFLSENLIYKTSFSKYGNAYTSIILPKTLENLSITKNNIIQKTNGMGSVENVA